MSKQRQVTVFLAYGILLSATVAYWTINKGLSVENAMYVFFALLGMSAIGFVAGRESD